MKSYVMFFICALAIGSTLLVAAADKPVVPKVVVVEGVVNAPIESITAVKPEAKPIVKSEVKLEAKPDIKEVKSTPSTSSINLVMPTCPTNVGDMIQIVINGVPPASLPKTRIWVAPSDGSTLITGQGLRPGDPVFIVFRTLKPGVYTFIVVAPDGSGDLLTASEVLIVKGDAPPPGPVIPPAPVDPPVTPTKLRVLVMYDPSNVIGMSEPQRQVIFSNAGGSMRAYLDDHCVSETVTDSAGGTDTLPARRVWPTTLDKSQAGTLWLPLVNAANGKPCIVIQAGDKITVHDLPATNDEAIKLLQPLGGK